MGSIPTFGERQAKKGLKLLGFEIFDDRGKGGHSLAKHPTRIPDPARQRANIAIPHRKDFGDPRFRNDFIKEVMAFGFSREDVLFALKGKKLRK